MKSCIVVSTPDAEFSALAFKEDFSESIRKVAEMGFGAVELAIRNPDEIDQENVRSIVKKYGLPVAAIGTGQAFGQEGLSFTNPDPDVRRRAIERIKTQMKFAKTIGNPQVIIGLIRGIVGKNGDMKAARRHFTECMRECADFDPEVTLTIEPINRYETDFLNDVEAACRAVDEIDRPNIRILVDTFHMNIEERDMAKSIERAKDYVGHVHFADSNRWAPGCGHIDFGPIVKTLRKLNYQGAVSAEILPMPSPDESARLSIEFFRKVGI